MSRYLFFPFPMHGHVNPLLPLVRELLARQEEVMVVVDETFAPSFLDAGAAVTTISTSVRQSVPERARRGGRYRRWRINSAVRQRRAALVDEWVRDWSRWAPDVVVADIYAEWGGAAARRTGTPLASFTGTYAVSRRMAREGVRRAIGPVTAALLDRSGLLRIVHPALRDRAQLALVNSTEVVQPERDSFDERYRFVGPLLRDGADGMDELPWDRLTADRVLFVSPGTVFKREARFFRDIVDAFVDTEWALVLATAATDPTELGPLPPNVIARRYVDQSTVLRRSDVFLTHAGMNSVLEAILHRVPMLCAPRSLDQKGITARLADLGVGRPLDPSWTGAQLLAAVREIADDPAVRADLDRLATPMAAARPAASAADALGELAERHRAAGVTRR